MIDIFFDTQKKSQHKDLILAIPTITLYEVADSYYYAIDTEFIAEEDRNGKVIKILRTLILGWQKLVGTLVINQSVFLPFDFSDEYIGGLLVKAVEQDDLSMFYGVTTSKKGWEISPSKSLEQVWSLLDFRIISNELKSKKADFLARLMELPKIRV